MKWISVLAMALSGTLLTASHAQAQGVVLGGVGPINRSMASAGMAASLDAAGAMHWNPGSISALPCSEVLLGVDLVYPSSEVSIGPATNGTYLSTTEAQSGLFALPSMAMVWKRDDSRVTYGLGMYSIGGYGVNYPANPPYFPQAVYSRLSVIQIAPTVSFQLTDRLSFGFSPTVNVGDAALDPVAPGGPAATHGQMTWGLGLQLGLLYQTDHGWNLGFSYKSPQWFEKFEYSASGTGVPEIPPLSFDYPGITSIGAAYHGLPSWVFAIDLRHFDYSNTDGFGDPATAGGLGWRSILAVATGAQFHATDWLSLRLGYLFTENPVPSQLAFPNISSAVIYKHMFSVGASVAVGDRTQLSIAYLHALNSGIEGPNWAAPGLTVRTDLHVDALVAGVQVRF